MEDNNSDERFDVAKFVVLSGWSLTILICLLIIGIALYQIVYIRTIDPSLKEWAAMCLGFFIRFICFFS